MKEIWLRRGNPFGSTNAVIVLRSSLVAAVKFCFHDNGDPYCALISAYNEFGSIGQIILLMIFLHFNVKDIITMRTLDPAYNQWKDAKETAGFKWMLLVTEPLTLLVMILM